MPNDNKLKGSGAARHNNIKHRDKAHPWHLPYLSTCIIKDCRTKPYYDGYTYFTCCLSCLRELELGPFFRNPNPRLFNAVTRKPVWACEDQSVNILGITPAPTIVTLEKTLHAI